MTAALGVLLVLDVRTGQAGVLEFLDGAGNVHGLTESGVRVHEARQVRAARDLTGALQPVAQRRR